MYGLDISTCFNIIYFYFIIYIYIATIVRYRSCSSLFHIVIELLFLSLVFINTEKHTYIHIYSLRKSLNFHGDLNYFD